jgi:chromosome segregation ATPase
MVPYIAKRAGKFHAKRGPSRSVAAGRQQKLARGQGVIQYRPVFYSNRAALIWLLATGVCACAERNKGPDIPSSAGEPNYAERLPDELEAMGQRYDNEAQLTDETTQKFGEFPAALDDPNWNIVLQVYERADQEGQSSAYVEHQREEAMLGRFLEQERKPLVRRVAASNEYVTKEQGCEVELWGATDRGLEKGFEERLEERRRSDSGAHELITLELDALGKKNEKTLRDQTDEIRFASFVVHVGLLSEEQAMRQRADEASASKSALEDHIEELKKRPEPDQERIARAEDALQRIDPQVQQAEQRLKQAEQKRKDLTQKYEDAFEQLKKAVQEAADAQQEGAEAKK